MYQSNSMVGAPSSILGARDCHIKSIPWIWEYSMSQAISTMNIFGILTTQNWHWISCPLSWVTLWGHLATPCWVKNLWSFAHLADIQLICEPSITPALQQQGNRCLMDWAGHQNLSSQDLAAFNCCQLAHRVYFLSDIMDGGSHSLCNLILLPPASPSMSSWHWPWAATVQKDWAIWQCLLPAGHHYHSRPMAQVSSPLCIHPIWPYHDNGLYCLAWLLLADLLPSQPPCNMADTYALPFSNCPWTTSELLFCMYPPLVQSESDTSRPSTTPSNSTNFGFWHGPDSLASELQTLGSCDLQLIHYWPVGWLLYALMISQISHSSLDTCGLCCLHTLALLRSLSSLWPAGIHKHLPARATRDICPPGCPWTFLHAMLYHLGGYSDWLQ